MTDAGASCLIAADQQRAELRSRESKQILPECSGKRAAILASETLARSAKFGSCASKRAIQAMQ